MAHPVRLAFCPILFGKNGGQFDDKGLPVFATRQDKAVRGRCDEAFDCGTCPFLSEWVAVQVNNGWSVGWECQGCLKGSKKLDEVAGIKRILPGYYQAGRKPYPPDHQDHDTDRPALEGCTVCGYESSFLQLVLRRR